MTTWSTKKRCFEVFFFLECREVKEMSQSPQDQVSLLISTEVCFGSNLQGHRSNMAAGVPEGPTLFWTVHLNCLTISAKNWTQLTISQTDTSLSSLARVMCTKTKLFLSWQMVFIARRSHTGQYSQDSPRHHCVWPQLNNYSKKPTCHGGVMDNR